MGPEYTGARSPFNNVSINYKTFSINNNYFFLLNRLEADNTALTVGAQVNASAETSVAHEAVAQVNASAETAVSHEAVAQVNASAETAVSHEDVYDEQLAGDFTQTSNYYNNINFISIL